MTNEEIAKIKTEVDCILRNPSGGNVKKLDDIASQIGAPTAPGGTARAKQQDLVHNIYTKLQTETMLNACNSAEKSCKWAAIAAIAAVVSVLVGLLSVGLKLVWALFAYLVNQLF